MARLIPAFLLLWLAFPAAGAGQMNEYSKSILYRDRGNPYDHLNEGGTVQKQQDAHCRELSQQMAKLKGKPQRRSAVAQRFDAECKTRNGPREGASLKESGRLYDSP